MDAPRDSRAPGASAPPSLFGASPKPAANGDLKILSALQTGPHGKPPVRRRSLWLGAGAATLIAAGVGYTAWSQTPAADTVAAAPAAPSLPASAMAASAPAVTAAASMPAPAASPMAALIENAPDEAPAAPVATPPVQQAALQTPPATAPAAPKPAAKIHVAAAQPQHKPAAHKHRGAAPVPVAEAPARKAAASKDADVDLLEAMVAHVRGKNAAKKAQQQQAAGAGKP